jgi:tetratricopeptide (TPR) repeat protein
LIDRIGDRERVYISGRYYQNITHEMNKAIDAYQLVERTYPRFAPPHNSLFVMYGNKGEYEKALAEEQEAFRLEPRNVLFMGNLMRVYIALDRFDEAKAITLKKMMAQKPDQPESHLELLNIAYIQDDHAAQEKEIDWFVGKPNEYLSSIAQAGNAMTRGQRRKAKELYQRAAELARGQGLTDVRFGPPPAVSDALMGDCAAARREKVLPALILCGDASAVRLAEEQSAKNPPQNPDLGPLLYQRGLAGLRAGKNAEAAAEFQKLLDHKGRNWGPRYPLSYLGLARASARVGDTAKANQTYKEFLAQWKDADSDIPILKEARKEYAALK